MSNGNGLAKIFFSSPFVAGAMLQKYRLLYSTCSRCALFLTYNFAYYYIPTGGLLYWNDKRCIVVQR